MNVALAVIFKLISF